MSLKVWSAVSALAVAALLYAAYKEAFPTVSYRYRLTMAFEVDGKLHRNSTVIEPQWIYQPKFGDAPPAREEVAGQALFIDLGAKGAIVAALGTGDTSQVTPDGAVPAQWLASRAFSGGPRGLDAHAMQRMTGQRHLAPDNMPRLIYFKDVADLKSATKFKPENIAAVLGPQARLVEAFVEITKAPIMVDLDRKLSWYRSLKSRGSMVLRDGWGLASTMFVGGT